MYYIIRYIRKSERDECYTHSQRGNTHHCHDSLHLLFLPVRGIHNTISIHITDKQFWTILDRLVLTVHISEDQILSFISYILLYIHIYTYINKKKKISLCHLLFICRTRTKPNLSLFIRKTLFTVF